MKDYLAVDLGASNGRTILGRFDGSKITLEELARFENNYVEVGSSYYWDVLHLYSCIKDGLRQHAKSSAGELKGIGIDTWGVDFGLLDKKGKLIGNPHSYRDNRGARGRQAFTEKYGERCAFDLTGISNMDFNTLYQLYDMVKSGDPQLDIAARLLTMPDLLGYMLCGVATTEYTHATTTQILDPKSGKWSQEIIEKCGVDPSIFAEIQPCGSVKGNLLPEVVRDTGLKHTPSIFCVGSHDTASAVASVPAESDNYAFISSGTWSLLGVVTKDAIINDLVYEQGFSNEGTVDGGFRILKNIMGLWVIQSCKRQWDREEKISWKELDVLVEKAPAFRSMIDVNTHVFYDGGNMIQKIQSFCEATGQPVPQTKGEIARTVYESLAMSYREAFEGLEQVKGGKIDVLHIVGGGSKNILLNQITADAINRPVVAGPQEATAIGNLMMQVKASGEVKDITQMRQVIRNSFDVEVYEPKNTTVWDEQFDRFIKIKELYKKNQQ